MKGKCIPKWHQETESAEEEQIAAGRNGEERGNNSMKKSWKSLEAMALGMVWCMALLTGCGDDSAAVTLSGQTMGTAGTDPGNQGQGSLAQRDQEQESRDQNGQPRNGQGQSGQAQDEQAQNGGRIILTLGGVYVPWQLEDAVELYNARNGNYYVEIVDYLPAEWSDGVYEAAYDRLRMDLAAGKTDILLFGDLVADEMGYAGTLLDLNALLTPEEKRQKYLGNILECGQTGDALYEISPAFTLAFIAGDGSRLGMGTGWTMEEMMESFERCGRDGSALGRGGVRTVERLVQYSIEDYVDWDAGTADFCKEEFYRILEFGRATDHGEFVRTTRESVASGIHLADCGGIGQMADVQYLHWLFGDNMAVKGWPCSQGTGVCVGFSTGLTLGIGAYGKCPEGAWDFVEFFIDGDWIKDTDKEHHHIFSNVFYGFPVNRQRLEEELEQSMVQQYYEGNPVPLMQGEGEVPDFYANSAEDVEELRKIIALADRRSLRDQSAIGQIIAEEIGGYNAGILTAEQTAEKIENRVQLYLDERR
ncbi:MAG: hypothetical protein NC420_06020 [Eubacterium sp.]|nr:hypothetical protein [Eubacterium sp.]MCM1304789.1 hypothetical protein [Butyrivibrio sp.]MCM1344544.1 hypothetical protein [Muribaculaceae bacterium]MCM1411848.1 hypothetical protein [Lachnospiraceae bacterium]